MKRHHVHKIVLILFTFSALTSAMCLGETENLLQKLYRLLRPFGHYDGSLSDAVANATEKGGLSDALPRLIILNRQNRAIVEWPPGRGAVDPVACPDGQTVFLRRGDSIESATFFSGGSQIQLPEASVAIPNLRARRLFACTHISAGEDSGAALWLQTVTGDYRVAKVDGDKAILISFPEELRSHQPLEIVTALRKLQGIRTDGAHALVRDQKLVISHPSSADTPLVVSGQMPFTGAPAWLGDTDFLVVTGLLD